MVTVGPGAEAAAKRRFLQERKKNGKKGEGKGKFRTKNWKGCGHGNQFRSSVCIIESVKWESEERRILAGPEPFKAFVIVVVGPISAAIDEERRDQRFS
jgi:hypothetical protein